MKMRLITLFASITLAAALTSCTSKKSSEDLDTANAEVAADSGGDAALDGGSTAAAQPSDQLAEDSLNLDSGAATNTASPELGADSLADTPLDTTAPNNEIVAPEPQAQAAAPVAEPVTTPPPASTITEAPAPVDASSAANTSLTDLDKKEEAKPKKSASLQKMATQPWKVGKNWVNTVYFARPGDSLSSISQTIYGSDKTADLKKANPTYKSRDVKPGDKVYYNSPNRADDSTKMITYFEDNNIQPKTYTTKEGDNVRKVSKKLLGYPEAWKEVWASNSFESKDVMEPGVEIKYWDATPSAGAAPAKSDVAMNTPPPAEMTPPPPVQNELPPPPPAPSEASNMPPPLPPTEMAPPPPVQNELPPPPPAPSEASNMPPPPPPAEMAPPPPAPNELPMPPKAKKQPKEAVAEDASGGLIPGLDGDMTMGLGVGALATVGLAALMIIRKRRRQKELEQAINETQVGT